MKRPFFILVLFVSLAATSSSAAELSLCQALDALRAEVRDSRTPAHIAVFNTAAESMVCRRGKEPAQADFCSAVTPLLGTEQMHKFPWLIKDCLSQAGVHPYLQTVDQITYQKNRNKIVRLWAGWPDGGRIDIQYVSADTTDVHNRFTDFTGAYKLTIWYP